MTNLAAAVERLSQAVALIAVAQQHSAQEATSTPEPIAGEEALAG